MSIHLKSFTLFVHVFTHGKFFGLSSRLDNMLFYFKRIEEVWKHFEWKKLYVENWWYRKVSNTCFYACIFWSHVSDVWYNNTFLELGLLFNVFELTQVLFRSKVNTRSDNLLWPWASSIGPNQVKKHSLLYYYLNSFFLITETF